MSHFLKKLNLVLLCLFAYFLTADTVFAETAGEKVQPDNLFPRVKIITNVGDIIVELDRNRAPITVNNFLTYVVTGRYDGTIFHRVVAEFVVQGGGYDILYNPKSQEKPIFNESGNGLKNEIYTIAMAREDDPHSATSQFYFNLSDNTNLDPGSTWGYTVFGVVMEGESVVDTIGRAQTHRNEKLGWDEVPVKQFVVKKVEVLPE